MYKYRRITSTLRVGGLGTHARNKVSNFYCFLQNTELSYMEKVGAVRTLKDTENALLA